MKEDEKSEFYTSKKYRQLSRIDLTESMEDYIEMILRISGTQGYTRINTISSMLNVSPSSASKMMNKLKTMGFVVFPKYGIIKLTPQGSELGRYLMWRHKTLEAFLCVLNGSKSELKQVEQIEHFLSKTTVKNIEKVTALLVDLKWEPHTS